MAKTKETEEQLSIAARLRTGDIDFEAALEHADEVEASFDGELFKGERLKHLIGVPFMVVGGTFREKKVSGKRNSFVTLCAVIADEKTLVKKNISLEGRELQPGQEILINDGSTGIRRQVVAYLHERELIIVNEGEITESGASGNSSYDLLPSDWKEMNIGDLTFKGEDGLAVWEFELPNGLYCPRGLRESTYQYMGKDVTTRYLA